MRNLILAIFVFVSTAISAQDIYPVIGLDYHIKNEISTTGFKAGFTDAKYAGGYAFYKRATYQLESAGLFNVDYKQNTYGIGMFIHIKKFILNVGGGVAVSQTQTETIYSKKEYDNWSDSMFELGLNYNISDNFAVGCAYTNTTDGFHLSLIHTIK